MSLRPVLTNISTEWPSELVVEKMPFDGVIRGIRLHSKLAGPPVESMLVKKIMVNDRELAAPMLGGILRDLPEDLEWGHVAKNDTVRITVQSTYSGQDQDPVQAILLVEPKSPDRVLTTLSMEPDAMDLCASAELVFDQDTFVTRIVVTPSSAMFTRFTMRVEGAPDPFVQDSHAHAFEGMDPEVGIVHLRAGVRVAINARWSERPGTQQPLTMVIYGRGNDG